MVQALLQLTMTLYGTQQLPVYDIISLTIAVCKLFDAVSISVP